MSLHVKVYRANSLVAFLRMNISNVGNKPVAARTQTYIGQFRKIPEQFPRERISSKYPPEKIGRESPANRPRIFFERNIFNCEVRGAGEAGHPTIPGQFWYFGSPERCGVALTVQISCLEIPTLEADCHS